MFYQVSDIYKWSVVFYRSMSQTATAQPSVDGFREGHAPVTLGPESNAVERGIEYAADKIPDRDTVEYMLWQLRRDARATTAHYEQWEDSKTEQVMEYVEGATAAASEAGVISDRQRLRLNQGAQGVVGLAIGIMATLMIGVVVLGRIDQYTPSLTGTWQNTSQNVSDSSSNTFGFLNLVPFIIVALFVLGLMMSRM